MTAGERRRPTVGSVAFVVAVLVVAGGLASLPGLLVGALGLFAGRFGGHRPAAAAALAALVYAAGATVLEVRPTTPVVVSYAALRPSAANAAKVAAVLVVVAVALAARDERAVSPATDPATDAEPERG